MSVFTKLPELPRELRDKVGEAALSDDLVYDPRTMTMESANAEKLSLLSPEWGIVCDRLRAAQQPGLLFTPEASRALFGVTHQEPLMWSLRTHHPDEAMSEEKKTMDDIGKFYWNKLKTATFPKVSRMSDGAPDVLATCSHIVSQMVKDPSYSNATLIFSDDRVGDGSSYVHHPLNSPAFQASLSELQKKRPHLKVYAHRSLQNNLDYSNSLLASILHFFDTKGSETSTA